MTPGARVQAAIEILDDIQGGTPAERAITGWARRSRFAGSKDRAAVRDHVFQALRCLRSYACLGGAATGRGVMIGALGAAKVDLAGMFTGLGYAPSPLTATEQDAGFDPRDAGDRMDLPDWIIPDFISALGGEAEANRVAHLLQQRAPVMLRVNARKASVAQAAELLAENGVTAVPSSTAMHALTVTDDARRVASSAAYLDGLVELQDGSSQAAMEVLEITPDARVLDYCAGGGGKVLALAARADAQWYAHDALPQRLKDLPERARRAGVNVAIVGSDDLPDHDFDLVLCDVPCSGSGTWRRNPDAKWRLTSADLEKLTAVQDQILERASALVRPGGCLAYATCSVLRQENEERLEGFTAHNPMWRVTFQKRWPVSEAGDGFFLAQLKMA
ncbi:RsmB/NOP family class I SAM-dependent RNA methyltransferase [Roseovarius aestuarii]|uniref:Ribosomal RNA small subunit methyltransferase B n=1 Tax=Roseovarius aestuarii TaxID=475083 RepID=A0A1X7BPR5_9RHOB|nr:RsmB/NOP family class I SAM-dependent RNA methyltransferase [Roseovarius aestuarii]SMC11615.1 Ribosomal RNA small subunit methyltransferase B [Roseovarius aestuarii]